MTEIVIEIADGGGSTIRVNGCQGPSCATLTKAFEEALGTTVSDVKLPEYHQTSKQGQSVQAGAK